MTQLKNLHQDGTITDSTYVISTIEKKWITFAELPAPIPADVSASVPKPAQAVAAPAPADPVQPLRKGFTHRLERLIQFNSEVGAWLAKVITFGKFNPENSASFEHALIKMGMLQVYFVWLSTVILCVTIGLIVNPAFAWVGIFIGIFLGFFFQYICYLFTETNIKLLTSVKIPLASMLFPRLMAIASLFLIIPCIIGMFTEPVYIPALPGGRVYLLSDGMAMPAFQSVLHMHLEKGGSPARTHCLFPFLHPPLWNYRPFKCSNSSCGGHPDYRYFQYISFYRHSEQRCKKYLPCCHELL